MADELKKDWRKEMEEREAEEKALEAEHQKKMRWYQRWDIVLNCLWALTIAFLTVLICMGAVHVGRRLDECIECRRTKTEVPTEVQTSTTAPRIVPDDIFKGYVTVTGAKVSGITRDGGLNPSPR